MPKLRRPGRVVAATLVLTLAVGGCRATGRAANSAFDWGGRTFTTNPASVVPYCIGFGLFFIAGLPLDIFSWVATAIGWPEGRGEDYQGSALAPSIFMGVGGGTILAAPFFPFGLPWWDPEREDSDAPPKPKPEQKNEPTTKTEPTTKAAPSRPDPIPAPSHDDDEIPAGAPRR